MSSRRWRIAGLNFDHMHMGDLLRMASQCPRAQVVGLCDADRERMKPAAALLNLPDSVLFTDCHAAMRTLKPQVALLCPATARHAEYVELVAPYGAHILVEKPMAASLAEADRMMAAAELHGVTLAINWPLAWYPPHVTTHRLISEGLIGQVCEVHYYDGNRGPMRHLADKAEVDVAEANRRKIASWWYRSEDGGGSLNDYLGYGVTLAGWFNGGQVPLEVTAVTDNQPGLEVDEHSITIVRYETGLSKFETRWGTYTDPWTHQPQPRCGFVLVGSQGTISSYDYQETVRVQTAEWPQGRDLPVDTPAAPRRNPIEYLLHCLETNEPVTGPLSPQLSRLGQRIVDAAAHSARERVTVRLRQ